MDSIKIENNQGAGLRLSVKLGNPRLECARFGICEINADEAYYQSYVPVDNSGRVCVFKADSQRLHFVFYRQSLTEETDKQHFGSGFFRMEAPINLPIEVTNKLGIKPSELAAGVYAVEANEQFYQVKMTIINISNGTITSAKDCGCSKMSHMPKHHLAVGQRY